MDSLSQFSWGSLLSLLMPANIIVRCISIICLVIGLIFSLPFIILIVFDFVLWIWRHVSAPRSTRQTQDDPVDIATLHSARDASHDTSHARKR